MKNKKPTPSPSLREGRFLVSISFLLVGAQLLLFLVSWLIAAVAPTIHVRSLLSSEGLRWFFGTFIDNITTPVLTWLLLIAMAVGTWRSAVPRGQKVRISPVVWAELFVVVVVMLLLTAVPHAILLSVTGSLFPSSFSQSIIPVLCFTVILCSITIGITNDRLRTLADIYEALSSGIHAVAPLIPIYIIAVELLASLRFVFMVE